MAAAARSCVASREKAEKLTPPSEPQIEVGEDIAKLVTQLSLRPDQGFRPRAMPDGK
jgi:hypothetical protein